MTTTSNNFNNNGSIFLGINYRYIKTIHGILHGIGSTVALILGNVVFVNRVLLGNQPAGNSMHEFYFHACNFLASATTAYFFWDKVQSWQLSTTTMAAKGLTPRILQRFNQGRGVVAMLLFSLFPVICRSMPEGILDSKIFSTGLAMIMITGSVSVFNLLKDYGKTLWIVYGMTPMALGVSILCCSRGTVTSIKQDYPMISDRFEKEASFVISCVQMGFMMYYLYSRNLVNKHMVQKICKSYHVTLSMIFLFRVERDLWLQFTKYTDTSIMTNALVSGTVPWPMLIQPIILTLALNAKLLPLILKKLLEMGFEATTTVQQKMMISSSEKQMHSLQPKQVQQSKRTSLVRTSIQRRQSHASTRCL